MQHDGVFTEADADRLALSGPAPWRATGFADMMFTLRPGQVRGRQVVASKVRPMLGKGVPGLVRLVKNGWRIASSQWERPASAEWWRTELRHAGFVDVGLWELSGGWVAIARRP